MLLLLMTLFSLISVSLSFLFSMFSLFSILFSLLFYIKCVFINSNLDAYDFYNHTNLLFSDIVNNLYTFSVNQSSNALKLFNVINVILLFTSGNELYFTIGKSLILKLQLLLYYFTSSNYFN